MDVKLSYPVPDQYADAWAATAEVCTHNLCKIITGGWQGVEVAFGVSKRVPWIGDGAVYSVSELAAKLCRAQAGKFAGEATRDPKFFCHILLTDFQCKHADCRLQIARTSVLFCGCFEWISPGPWNITVNGLLPSLHAIVSMDHRLSYHPVSNLD